MKIVVLGSNGQLGLSLKNKFANTKHNIFFFDKHKINITDKFKILSYLKKLSPNVIINAAAYTAVDNAEIEKNLCNSVNNIGISYLSQVCEEVDALLIHISTDYVFDGKSKSPYTENDAPNPINFYGLTKYKGEIAIKKSNCRYFIIRVSSLFSEYNINFLKTMVRLSLEKEHLKIVDDQISCPTYANDLSNVIYAIIERNSDIENRTVLHFCGDRALSWSDFASHIFNQALELNIISKRPEIIPISSRDYNSLAKRPLYSELNTSKITKLIGVAPSNFNEGIKTALINIRDL